VERVEPVAKPKPPPQPEEVKPKQPVVESSESEADEPQQIGKAKLKRMKRA